MYSYLFINILLVAAALADFVLGGFVFAKKKTDETAFPFTMACICIGLWSLGIVFFRITNDLKAAYFWNQEFIFTAGLVPIAFVQFTHAFINRPFSLGRKIIIYIPAAFILYGVITPNAMIKEIVVKSWGKESILGYAYPIYGIYFTGYMGYGFMRLFKVFLNSQGLFRLRVKYVIFGILPATIIGAYFNLYLVLLGNYKYIWVGPYCSFILVSVIAYAIYKHRLMDINVVITRGIVFGIVYTVILGIPFWVFFGMRKPLEAFLGGNWAIIPLILSIFLCTAGPFIYTYLQRKAERRIRKEEFLAHKALNELAQDMMRFTRLPSLLKLIAHYVVKIMKVNFAAIYLKDETSRHYLLRAIRSLDKTSPVQTEFPEDSPLINDILSRKVAVVTEELKLGQAPRISPHFKRLQLELNRSKATVIVPAFKGDYPYGFLMLGSRKDNRIFTQEDLNLLSLLATQAVFAIENARLIEKDKTLLAAKSRRDALADMAPGVSHQFSNRLAVITYLAGAQRELNQVENIDTLPQEKATSLLRQSQTAFDNIEKEAMKGKDISEAILKKGRAKLIFQEAELAPVIESAIKLFELSQVTADKSAMPEYNIILKAEPGLPKLVMNESLIQDIIYNLLKNSVDAIFIRSEDIRLSGEPITYKGRIIIRAYKKDSKIIIEVEDNGIGMDAKQLKRLFVPYFTTKATSIKGTGMGLWVIRGFIEDHKGTVRVKSEYNMGTTFIITLPLHAKIEAYPINNNG